MSIKWGKNKSEWHAGYYAGKKYMRRKISNTFVRGILLGQLITIVAYGIGRGW